VLTKVFTSLFPHLILSPTALHPIHPIPSRHHFNLNPQRLIPSIRRARILRPQRSNHSLSTQTRIFPRLTRRTHIRQLIANPFGDDIRVQSVLLPFRNHWIRGRKVPSVAFRPARPNWKSIAGEQVPKSVVFVVVVEIETTEAASRWLMRWKLRLRRRFGRWR
jgi:hypothetical protein